MSTASRAGRSPPAVSVVLGSYNRRALLESTIGSIREEIARCSVACEIIAVDGGSTDGALEWLVRQKDVVTIVQHNRGTWRGKPVERRSWGYFMNLGFKAATGRFVCMVSDDCIVLPGAIENGHRFAETRLRDGDRLGAVPVYFRDWPFASAYHVTVVAGHPYVNHGLYLTEALRDVGFADEEGYRFYCADIDLVLRMRAAGYQSVACPEAFVEHFSHANAGLRGTNTRFADEDWKSLRDRWEGRFGPIEASQDCREHTDPLGLARRHFTRPMLVELARRAIRDPLGTARSYRRHRKAIHL